MDIDLLLNNAMAFAVGFGIGILLSPVWILSFVFCLAIRDIYKFVIYSELHDGYSEWDKLWIIPPHIPSLCWRFFKRELGLLFVAK